MFPCPDCHDQFNACYSLQQKQPLEKRENSPIGVQFVPERNPNVVVVGRSLSRSDKEFVQFWIDVFAERARQARVRHDARLLHGAVRLQFQFFSTRHDNLGGGRRGRRRRGGRASRRGRQEG